MSRSNWLITGLMLLMPAVLAADSQIDRLVSARPDGLVSISNVAGSVTVTGWDRAEVQVTGRVGGGVEEVRVESRGGSVDVEVEMKRGRHGSGANLDVRVPRGSDLDVEVVSAEVEVEGVEGDVTVESVSGSVDVAGRMRDLDVESVSGSIDVDADAEQASLESVSGRIRLQGAIGEIEAGSVSGRLEIDTGEIRRAEFETTSGQIDVSGSLAAGAEIEIESHSGGVELSLPSSTSARFQVATYSGRISNELGPPPERARYGPSKELEFTAGGGDARVRIDTFSGSVSLRARD